MSAVPLLQREHGIAVTEEDGVTTAARQEVHSGIGLANVGLEGQRRGQGVGRHRGGVERSRPFELLAVIDGEDCTYLPDLVFQIPVTTQSGTAGQVIGGRNIGAGQCSQVVHQQLAGIVCREIATIDKDVAAFAEGTAPGTYQVRIGRQRVIVQRTATEIDGTLRYRVTGYARH